KVTPDTCFVGLDAYQKVISSGVDVVLLATPPGFRPVHLKAAIDAGKHVFCEKPMATDAPGVRSVFESAKAAREKNLSLVAGFCWRRDVPRREFYRRIHDGAIGDIRAIYATYYTGPAKPIRKTLITSWGRPALEKFRAGKRLTSRARKPGVTGKRGRKPICIRTSTTSCSPASAAASPSTTGNG